jgi:hypothetical protein
MPVKTPTRCRALRIPGWITVAKAGKQFPLDPSANIGFPFQGFLSQGVIVCGGGVRRVSLDL